MDDKQTIFDCEKEAWAALELLQEKDDTLKEIMDKGCDYVKKAEDEWYAAEEKWSSMIDKCSDDMVNEAMWEANSCFREYECQRNCYYRMKRQTISEIEFARGRVERALEAVLSAWTKVAKAKLENTKQSNV